MQEEEARELVAAMVEQSALESLVQRLGSFNESNDDEAEAVTNTLAIFENVVELSTNVGPMIALDWTEISPHGHVACVSDVYGCCHTVRP